MPNNQTCPISIDFGDNDLRIVNSNDTFAKKYQNPGFYDIKLTNLKIGFIQISTIHGKFKMIDSKCLFV